MAKTILVTGGTGYIGGEVIDQLLERGHSVRTTVRSRSRSEPQLRARWPDAGETLRIFEADLMEDRGWADASAGCDVVAHVASPLPVGVPRNADELIVPAREGTLRALRFAQDAGVRHFVQTSSNAAISYGHPRGKTDFDEGDWTDPAAPGVQPYIRSKTIAERAAREWVAANAPDMAFCSINPVLVLGPVASADFSASVEVVRRLLTGGVPLVPDIGFSVVDVRDVAWLHVMAIEANPAAIRDARFAASAGFLWMAEVARILRDNLGEQARRVPSHRMPDLVLRLLALFSRDLRQLTGEIGVKRTLSARHAGEVFGWSPLPPAQTVLDTAHSLIARGIVAR